jgi:hypothetical protein
MDVVLVVLVIASLLAAVAAVALGVLILRRLSDALAATERIGAEAKAVAHRVASLEDEIARARLAQETALSENLRQVRADVKTVELKLAEGRENPEAIEAAIKLAKEGVDTEMILKRTSLPREVVESIVLFHGMR